MHLRPFEIGLIVAFAVAAIGGLIALKMYQGDPEAAQKTYGDSVVIWGTASQDRIQQVLLSAAKSDQGVQVVTYVQKDSRTFDTEYINAIADGKAPDIVLLPHTKLVSLRSKLYPIPYEWLPERTFRDTYVDGAEIFMLSDGIYAIPFGIDPLVLYWNRDLFSGAGLAAPPKTWENLIGQAVPALVHRDDSFTITQSAIALGEFSNIAHAKEILSMLFLQAGNALVVETGSGYQIIMGARVGNTPPVSDTVIQFYTQFASPLSPLYTWNRSQKQDRAQFLGGTLGMYFGSGTEFADIRRNNPNLNFDIAPVPQESGATVLRDYGTVYGFAISRASSNVAGAYALARALSSTYGDEFASALDMAPANRALYGSETDAFKKVVNQSALIARGWLEPSPNDTTAAFKSMIEDVTSGRKRASQSVGDTVDTLNLLFR